MRRLALLRWIGIALLGVALLLNPGPPYQDPTPELTAKFNAEAVRCGLCALIGMSLAAIGFLANHFVDAAPTERDDYFQRVFDRVFDEH